MDLAPGTSIDRYTVERELGRGGMAVVYLVRHTALDTLHALKVLSVGSAKVRDRLLQEGRVQAHLRHPNAVAVTDVLDVDGSPGLLMEYVEGPSLEAWLCERRLKLDEAERLFLGILDGVERAHSLGIVHRDLKPANVMLGEGTGGWVPKVADFGLAKALQEEGDQHRTRTGMPMGTPSYMSPEQIRDAKGVDERADIFALGCILHELCRGQRAFVGRDMLEIFNAVVSGRTTASGTLVPELPDRVERAIRGALMPERERRIPDCATLRAVLRGEHVWEASAAAPPDATFELDDEPSPAQVAALGALQATAAPAPRPAVPPLAPFVGGDTTAPSMFPAVSQSTMEPSDPPPPPAEPVPAPPRGGNPLPWLVAFAILGLSAAVLLTWQPWQGEPAVQAPAAKRPTPAAPVVVPEPMAPEPPEPGHAVEPATPPERAPAPATTPAPEPAALSHAIVSFTGADALVLEEVDFRHRLSPGPVPPGHYRLLATFGEAAPVTAGEIDVHAGQHIALLCDADFRRCEAR